ncbi:hypothetical protein [Streptomyces noursei]|uniref:hypothetical protein n=1 Tax=Streptomyces noursei TaxID=1971 RepID=UPI001676FD83|nr:hypothetical protein [Streptomyces noursei]MCZ1013974.1 hypothetical protein [Streptomyces noursei]GGX40472.1 hypothetical protein GCM10010341_72990 [Streptomyces noursei]
MSKQTSFPYIAARLGFEVLGGIVIIVVAGATALLTFHSVGPGFIGGADGRIAYTGLTAAVAAHAAGHLFEAVLGGFRDRLVEARRGLLIEAAKDARDRHAKALAQIDLADPRTEHLFALKGAVAKAEDRALKAGVLPSELG